MTAKITNMAEYRARKEGRPIRHESITALNDRQVTTRLEMLRYLEEGVTSVDTFPQSLLDNLFPNGYDRERHPEDDYATLLEEAQRRGLAS